MRPWLLQLGPLSIPTDGRDELNALATGLTAKEFVNKVWEKRCEGQKRVRPRSRSWPKSIRCKNGYRLPPNLKLVTPSAQSPE